MNMKIKLFLALLFSALFSMGNAQILNEYPEGQDFYEGGIAALSNDVLQAIKTENLKPCNNKEEIYTISVLVNPDSKINLVKDFDTLNIRKNNCAFEFSKKLLSHLKKWQPAIVEGVPVKAVASFTVKPADLFYTKTSEVRTAAEFPKGMHNFRMIVKDIFTKSLKHNKYGRTELTFVVGLAGNIEDVVLKGDYNERDRKRLIYEITNIKERWKPETINGQPVKSRMKMIVNQEFDHTWEREKFEQPVRPGINRMGF